MKRKVSWLKRCMLVIATLTLGANVILAQEINVKGTVTSSEDGLPIPGVSVVQKGTTNGTITDIDGNYNLTISQGSVLVFSFVGMKSQEVTTTSATTYNVVLDPEVKGLDEVVVTALGIKRERKALGYSITEVGGEDFMEAREINVGDALAGKVAGVNVSNIGSGVAGSSRVVIRGNTSIQGNNQPLYVIDGVPIDNTQQGNAGMWGGQDWGDGLNSLNPDDFESVSVLKGNTAAALYGSRASNGVILITTKKGVSRKGVGIEFNSNFTFDNFINSYDFQTQYGHGSRGEKPVDASEGLVYGNQAWGGKLDGTNVYQFDGVQRPYKDTGDNFKRYYRTGTTFTNTLSLVGGNDKQTFRFSFSNLDNKSITPNSGMVRRNVTLSTNAKWFDNLSLTAKIQYSNEDVDNRARLSDAPGNGNYTLSVLPPSIDVEDLKGTTGKLGAKEDGTELQYSDNIYSQNPYWAAYQFSTKDVRDRLIGSGLIRYDITPWLFVHGRLGMDWSTIRRTAIEPYGTAYKPLGGMQEVERRVRETNLEFVIGADKEFGDLGINAFFGGNQMRRDYEEIGASGNNFNIPFFHTISNLSSQSVIYDFNEKGINSLFGSAEFSYRSILFLTFTGRNDWFSTLDPENNSIFYPSVGGSWVISDTFTMPNWMTFAKLRGSWAQVGGDTDPYQTSLAYKIVGQGHLGVPLGRIDQSSVPNSELKPLTSTEFEIGVEASFFQNRLSFDYAYYNRKTEDDILQASVSEATGYSSATVNVGEMKNTGHEILVKGTPVKGELTWDVSLSYAYNNNEVVKLVGDQTNFQAAEARSRNVWIHHIVGDYYSAIVGYKHKMINGKKVYDSNGFPVRGDETEILGYGVQPNSMGLNNSFSWKNLNLNFLVDMKWGGDIYTGTNAVAYSQGMHKNTLEGRESGLTINGVNEEGVDQTWNISKNDLQDYYGEMYNIADYFVEDASYIKLRQIVLAYKIPNRILEKTPIASANVSVVGRNLLLIYSKTDNVDPESTYSNDNAQGLEWFGVPQTRSFGFNLNLKF